MRLRVDAINSYTYPDVSIICGKPEFTGFGEDILLNPTVIIEVLPKSNSWAITTSNHFENICWFPNASVASISALD